MSPPSLRFSRDKRGYENTFIVHADKRRGRSRSRILYWFRTPPGIRVGRAAFDEEAIRLLEQHNPGLEFDWTFILKGGGDTTAPVPEPRTREQERGRREDRRRPPQRRAPAPTAQEPVRLEEAPAPQAAAEAELPARNAGEPQPPAEDALPARGSLGAEGVLRLQARYAEILARIGERVEDPGLREQLKVQAERLNPDTWVTTDDVRSGLEQYETVLESLRAVIGGRRHRRRRAEDRVDGDSTAEPLDS